MSIKNTLFGLIFLSGAFFLTACSSIKKKALNIYLSGFQDKKAEKKVPAPPLPYKKQKHPALDALWWNPQSKSSISYFSACTKAQKTLREFQNEAVPAEGKYDILKESVSEKNLYLLLEMNGSDQKSRAGIYTFREGNCYFNIQLVADSASSFNKEEPVFKAFIKSFYSQ